MRVIVTRPSQEAAAWMDPLSQAGHTAVHWPLIEIAAPRNHAPVQEAWSRWTTWQAVMFVSAQAVRLFFAQRPAGLSGQAAMPRCWATGMGTRRALLEVGVPEARSIAPASRPRNLTRKPSGPWCVTKCKQVNPS
jgi:uroporphyrinogen-III synthase